MPVTPSGRRRAAAIAVMGAAVLSMLLAGCSKSCDDIKGTWVPLGAGEVYLPPYFNEASPAAGEPKIRRFFSPGVPYLDACAQWPEFSVIAYVGHRDGMPRIQPGMATLRDERALPSMPNGPKLAVVASKPMEDAGFQVAAVLSGDYAVLLTGEKAYAAAERIASTYRIRER